MRTAFIIALLVAGSLAVAILVERRFTPRSPRTGADAGIDLLVIPAHCRGAQDCSSGWCFRERCLDDRPAPCKSSADCPRGTACSCVIYNDCAPCRVEPYPNHVCLPEPVVDECGASGSP